MRSGVDFVANCHVSQLNFVQKTALPHSSPQEKWACAFRHAWPLCVARKWTLHSMEALHERDWNDWRIFTRLVTCGHFYGQKSIVKGIDCFRKQTALFWKSGCLNKFSSHSFSTMSAAFQVVFTSMYLQLRNNCILPVYE